MKSDGIYVLLLVLFFLFFAALFFKPWIIGDGLHYYATLRSVVIDGDVDFSNEYAYLRTLNRGWVIDPKKKTVTGLVPNPWAVGNAFFWSPFFLTAHFMELSQGGVADGYSQTYFSFVTLGTLLCSLLTILLINSFLKTFAKPCIAFISTLSIFVCSQIFYYTYHDPSMSHVFSAFTVTLFLIFWFRHSSRGLTHAVIIGALAGFMVLTRWQNALFMVVFFYDLPTLRRLGFRELSKGAIRKLMMVAVAFIVFIPQMVFWKKIYGSYLLVPQGSKGFYPYPKHLIDLLVSPTHGLFTWTPIIFLSIMGLVVLLFRNRRCGVQFSIPLLLQILFLAGYRHWHGDWSYGIRGLTNCSLIFGIGLAVFLSEVNKRLDAKYLSLILAPFFAWSILLMTQIHFSHGLIDPQYPFHEIVENQFKVAPALFIKLVKTKISSSVESVIALILL